MEAKKEADHIARSDMNRVSNAVHKLNKGGPNSPHPSSQESPSTAPPSGRKDLPPPVPPPRQNPSPHSAEEAREHLSALLKEVLGGKTTKASPIQQTRKPLLPPPPQGTSVAKQPQSSSAIPRPVVPQQQPVKQVTTSSPPQRIKGPPLKQPLRPPSTAANKTSKTSNERAISPTPRTTTPNTVVLLPPPQNSHTSNKSAEQGRSRGSVKANKSEGSISPNKPTSALVSPTAPESKPIAKNRFRPLSLKSRPETLKKYNSDSNQEDFIAVGCVDDKVFEIVPGDVYGVKKHPTGQMAEAIMEESGVIRTTEQLPYAIEGFPKGKRNQLVHEMYTSEFTYVQGLEVLIDVFKRPLIPIMSMSEIDAIFANVEIILHLNLEVLAALHARLSNWSEDACIGDIFVSKFSHNKTMYAVYCNNYDSAEQSVLQKLKRKKDFETSIQLSMSDPRVQQGLPLPGYLILPVQRIPRYILLLRQLLEVTAETHADYMQLQNALDIMVELAEYIDEQIKESQSKEKLRLLQHRVSGLMDITGDKSRVLIKEGQVFLKSISKLYRCLLFNDLLVFALGDTSKSTVELQLPLESVWIADLEDLDPATSSNDAVDLYTPSRPFTIYTKKSNEKKLWLTAFKDAIFNHLQLTGKIEDPNPTAKDTCVLYRTALHCYPDGSVYEGHFWDGRRHGYGIMKLPNKTVYKGNWVDDERSGQGELQYNTGEVYKGEWLNDKQHGYGELRYCNDDMYKGNWLSGEKHGKGVIEYSNQDMFEGTFVEGRIEGHGRLVCASGMSYDGMWEKSLRHGTGTLAFPNGNTYNGDFKKNSMTGHGIMKYWNQDVYEGEFKNGLRHGHGIMRSRDGSVYEGRWERDLRNGQGKLVYWNKSHYDGLWRNDMRHGQGVFQYSNGDIYSGEFENDLINGEGEIKYANGGKYEGLWKYGRYNGRGVRRYANGAAYNGEWKDGLRHGEGEIIYADGTIYKGMWENDQPHGKGSLTRQKVLHYEGDWVFGVRQGQGRESSYEGVYEGEWKNNMRHGQGKEKTVVGTVYEGNWDHNRKTSKGVQKLIFGIVNEQVWSVGHLESNPLGDTAVELPHLPRTEV